MHMFVKVHCKRPINGPGWTCGHHHYCSQMTSMMPASKLVSVLSKTGRTPPACPRVSAWAWGPELSTGCKSAGRLHSCCLAWNRNRLGRHWNGEKFRSRYEVWNLCWDTWWTSLRAVSTQNLTWCVVVATLHLLPDDIQKICYDPPTEDDKAMCFHWKLYFPLYGLLRLEILILKEELRLLRCSTIPFWRKDSENWICRPHEVTVLMSKIVCRLRIMKWAFNSHFHLLKHEIWATNSHFSSDVHCGIFLY